MTVEGRALRQPRRRAERVRARRARQDRHVEVPVKPRRPTARPRRRPRRRYDLALPVEVGAEVRLPALPSVRLGTRALSLTLLAAVMWAMQWAYKSPTFRVEAVQVEGASMLSPARIRSAARVEDRLSFTIDPRASEQALERLPEIEQAQVSVRWPNRVQIAVRERPPRVAWEEMGRTWWLSAEGVAYLAHGEAQGLVRVRAEARALKISEDPLEPALSPETLQAAEALATQLPQAGVLLYDPDRGFGFEDPRGWKVYFGGSGDMQQKVSLYQAIVASLEAKGVRPTLVSLENLEAPYYSVQR